MPVVNCEVVRVMAKSNKQWLREHHTDLYVKQAQRQGFRSRAAYKLLALHEKDRLFARGQSVLDLGAAPGAWSQVARQLVGLQGTIFAADILPIDSIQGVTFIQGDLCQEATLSRLYDEISPNSVDLVISDIAPNLSGIVAVDQARMIFLVELALNIAETLLKPKANFLVKCFQGTGFESYLKTLRRLFKQVVIRKPPASRARSSEVYLVAKHYQAKVVG